jgi:hypothetical protein
MFGTLRISKGALEWLPASGKYGRSLSWERLDQLAEQFGRPVR